MRAARVVLIASAVSLPILGTAPPSIASPPPSSAIWQYVEVVPTSGGGHVEHASKAPSPLSGRATRAIGGASDAESSTLRKVATSAQYGAPARHARVRSQRRTPRHRLSAPPVRAATAATPLPNQSWVDATRDPAVAVLLGVIVATLAAAAAVRFAPGIRRVRR